jgi:hypothetical protein
LTIEHEADVSARPADVDRQGIRKPSRTGDGRRPNDTTGRTG